MELQTGFSLGIVIITWLNKVVILVPTAMACLIFITNTIFQKSHLILKTHFFCGRSLFLSVDQNWE